MTTANCRDISQHCKGNSSGSDIEEATPRSAPQVFFCSRTHSQLSQFVVELGRTPFAQTMSMAVLAGRKVKPHDPHAPSPLFLCKVAGCTEIQACMYRIILKLCVCPCDGLLPCAAISPACPLRHGRQSAARTLAHSVAAASVLHDVKYIQGNLPASMDPSLAGNIICILHYIVCGHLVLEILSKSCHRTDHHSGLTRCTLGCTAGLCSLCEVAGQALPSLCQVMARYKERCIPQAGTLSSKP